MEVIGASANMRSDQTRLVVYLWPRAGGTDFDFTFRERYEVNALTAPSVLYDYYNPDAQTVVQPTRIDVREDRVALGGSLSTKSPGPVPFPCRSRCITSKIL